MGAGVLMVFAPMQGVLVEGSPVGGELHAGTADWEGLVREGVSCFAQVDEWVEGQLEIFRRGVLDFGEREADDVRAGRSQVGE